MEMGALYEMIPKGHKNGIKISDIKYLWGLNRRQARKMIESMCLENMIVCNTGRGYFRPENIDEFEAYLRYIHSYYKKFATKLYHIKKAMEIFRKELRRRGEPICGDV